MNKYDEDFRTAHLSSWPMASLGFSRQIFDRDRVEIMAAAKKHGYSILGELTSDPFALRVWKGSVHFMKLN